MHCHELGVFVRGRELGERRGRTSERVFDWGGRRNTSCRWSRFLRKIVMDCLKEGEKEISKEGRDGREVD